MVRVRKKGIMGWGGEVTLIIIAYAIQKVCTKFAE